MLMRVIGGLKLKTTYHSNNKLADGFYVGAGFKFLISITGTLGFSRLVIYF